MSNGFNYSLPLTHYRLLTFLCSVETAALLTAVHTLRIQNTANDVVTHTWKVLYTATADENHGVLLQVVTFSWNICRNFHTVGKAHLRNFA